MAKNKSKEPVNVKDDGIFRIYIKTNGMKAKIIYKVELPSNEVYENNYGNIVKYEVMEDYIGEVFERYTDNQFDGKFKLLECNKYKIKYDRVE